MTQIYDFDSYNVELLRVIVKSVLLNNRPIKVK